MAAKKKRRARRSLELQHGDAVKIPLGEGRTMKIDVVGPAVKVTVSDGRVAVLAEAANVVYVGSTTRSDK